MGDVCYVMALCMTCLRESDRPLLQDSAFCKDTTQLHSACQNIAEAAGLDGLGRAQWYF